MYEEDDVYGFVTGFYRSAYYATTGTTWKILEADNLTGSTDYTGVNLTLIVGPVKTLKGVISLPDSVSSFSGEVGVDIYDAEGHVFTTTWKDFLSGETSVAYAVDLPEGTVETWKVGYHVADQNIGEMLETGFYTPTCIVRTYPEAVDFSAAQDHDNIDIQMILTGDTCTVHNFPWAEFLPSILGMGSR
jgi:hypothetical protein